MQRRKFLNASVWGALGCAVLPGSILSHPADVDRSTTGITKLFDMLGFKKQHIFSIDDSLHDSSIAQSVPYINCGYTQMKPNWFWLAGEDHAILPLLYQHQQLGCLDSCTLHFKKSSGGDWDYCGALSGYHIEALQRVLHSFGQQYIDSEYCRHLLMPVGEKNVIALKKNAYNTALGSFELNVHIKFEYSLVKGRLIQSGDVLWSEEYFTDHMRVTEQKKFMS